MDVPSFLQYIRNMEYPTLVQEQEQKLRKDIENLVDITFPNISNELETSFADGLEDAMKFLALFVSIQYQRIFYDFIRVDRYIEPNLLISERQR